ncbi:MAG: CinA family protein, partial [Gammaproteobacteria bacterium]|nr:CinA family protein [Gammaproteobacteria bacterium]
TAESCTGGGIAEAVTAVAGSSAWFEAGFVTYSNRSKEALLAVPSATLECFGAVSEETVRAMAAGALALVAADWAIAVSGIAGPAGGLPDKPVGTVWINWTGRSGFTRSQRYCFGGDRQAIRQQSVAAALRGLLDVIRG